MKKERTILYEHNGNLYSLVSDDFRFKFEGRTGGLYWDNGLILYKAEYPNEDGPYFGRTANDFKENFKPVMFRHKKTGEWLYNFEYCGMNTWRVGVRINNWCPIFLSMEDFYNAFEKVEVEPDNNETKY